MDHHLKRGQVYRSCAVTAGPPRYVRILVRAPGRRRVTIVDAATNRRERDVDVGQLHPYPVGPWGGQHRRGYVHTAMRSTTSLHAGDTAGLARNRARKWCHAAPSDLPLEALTVRAMGNG
ncbi:hypothetical protein ABTZ57_39240 [Streptomyces sp. NPDC094048]|uniref:hypothetical protein n=1 Tax=unclassified Streptomyces TaxID=2593676 RepID=UPI003329EC2C